MKAYKVVGSNEHEYRGTLKEAHEKAKDYVGQRNDWRDVQIFEVEVPSDKENLIHLLNGVGIIKLTERTWEFKSARLGLVEVTGLE